MTESAICSAVPARRRPFIKMLFYRKTTALLLLAACLYVHTGVLGQKVSISGKNLSVEKILSIVKKQTGYDVIYNPDLIRNAKLVSISVKDAELEDALTLCFKEQPFSFSIRYNTIVLTEKAEKKEPAPAIRKETPAVAKSLIKGTVTNEAGEPLEAATIRLRGTNTFTTTNDSGRFSIEANTGNVLEISRVGHLPLAFTIGTQTEPLIQLQSAPNSNEEVVVVGYGNKQKKISVVGAIATVSAKELKQSPVANISNALAGRLPGLFTVQSSGEPGAGTNFYIRGKSTIGGSNSPLIVVDGLERDAGDFGNIDPNEIENISILKDASSTALYGIRGANGVVVVTTRRGKAGRRPEINFTAQYGMQSPTRLPEFLDQYQLALYEEESSPGTYTTQELQNLQKGNFDPNYYLYTDWYKYLLKNNAPQQNYNVNFSGGSEFVRYFVSGSYTKQASMFDHEDENPYGIKSNFNRFNFRSNIDIDVTKMLSLQVDMAGRLESRVGPSTGYDGLLSQMTRFSPATMAPRNYDGSFNHGGKIYVADDNPNPYAALINNGYFNNFWNNMYGTFSAKHKLDFITRGLSIQGQISFQTNNQRNISYTQSYDAFRYDPTAPDSLVRTSTAGTLQLSDNSRPVGNRNNYEDIRLNYLRKFGKHDVTGQVLGNRSLRYTGDYIPFVSQGVSSRFTYGYDNRYFAEANFAYNGSENFAPGNRYGFFPAFSAGWVVTNEQFVPKNDLLTYLKIRGSYGIVGNDQLLDASGNPIRFLYISDFSGSSSAGYNENRVGNPNVTWERSKKMNIGVDATFFRGFAEVVFDVFKEERNNILLPVGVVPAWVGISNLAQRNSGSVENKGFEAELKLKKKLGRDFSVFTNFQLTHARNKVLQNDKPTLLAYQSLIGYEIGYDLGYKAIGLFNSWDEVKNSPVYDRLNTAPGDIKYLDVNKDGIIDASDRVPLQFDNFPRFVYGISAGFSYKGLDISVLFNGTKGSVINMTPANRDYFLKGRKIWEDRWTPDNTENAQMPRALRQATWNQIKSDFWNQNSDYLKLRNAEIGYELPVSLIKKAGIKYARFFVNGQNLVIWDKLWIKEGDPENSGSVTIYPLQKVVNVGVNIRF